MQTGAERLAGGAEVLSAACGVGGLAGVVGEAALAGAVFECVRSPEQILDSMKPGAACDSGDGLGVDGRFAGNERVDGSGIGGAIESGFDFVDGAAIGAESLRLEVGRAGLDPGDAGIDVAELVGGGNEACDGCLQFVSCGEGIGIGLKTDFPVIDKNTSPDDIPNKLKSLIALLKNAEANKVEGSIVSGYKIDNL